MPPQEGIASAPRAGELKIPYFVVSEGYHVASGKLNRYVFQPGITDVRAQVTAMASYITDKLGKKVTMIIPDYIFGYNHRDFFSETAKAQGGEVNAVIHKGFGLGGTLTNGVMRDLGDVPEGYPILAGSIGPSHGFVHVVANAVPVTVFGLT